LEKLRVLRIDDSSDMRMDAVLENCIFYIFPMYEFSHSQGHYRPIQPCNRSEPVCFSPYPYRARNLVERFFNKIKHCRRAATRYDKLAANYLAMVQLASIRLWLRANKSTS
jgi:transposase